MNLLSLDLSTKSTGYAVFIKEQLIDYGCITANSADVISRIRTITEGLKPILQRYEFDKIIIEEVIPKKEEPANKNQHTQKILMWLQAAIAFLIYDNFKSIEIQYLYPSEWRSLCGIKTGQGIERETLKKADIAFVKNTFDFVPANDDIADAICIGHSYLMKPAEGEQSKPIGMIKFGKR